MEENKGRNDTLRKRKVIILLLLLKNGVKQKGIHKLKQDKWNVFPYFTKPYFLFLFYV